MRSVKRGFTALVMVAVVAGCGRIETALRGSTSIFHRSAPAPVHATLVPDDARLAVLWVGHATVVIQLDGRTIVTDPVFTDTVGELSKRRVAPGLTPDELPALELALVSHVHFDHLSYGSLAAIETKLALLAMPEGGLAYLPEFVFDAREVATWSSFEHAGMRVTAVPALHGGHRYGVDAGWAKAACGWVLERSGIVVYFAGDTGFSTEHFAAIRKTFPAIDLAILPIAPMEPHHLVGAWHMDPKEAVAAFRALGAKAMLPIHFDTFVHSLDAPGDAPKVLAREVATQKVDPGRVHTLQIGERRVLLPR